MTGKTWAAAIFLLSSFCLCRSALAQDEASCLPDVQLTPGHASALTAADICKLEYDNPASKIPTALKSRVFARYGVNRYEVGYNVDHLIPARLGGSNGAGAGKTNWSADCASWFAAGDSPSDRRDRRSRRIGSAPIKNMSANLTRHNRISPDRIACLRATRLVINQNRESAFPVKQQHSADQHKANRPDQRQDVRRLARHAQLKPSRPTMGIDRTAL